MDDFFEISNIFSCQVEKIDQMDSVIKMLMRSKSEFNSKFYSITGDVYKLFNFFKILINIEEMDFLKRVDKIIIIAEKIAGLSFLEDLPKINSIFSEAYKYFVNLKNVEVLSSKVLHINTVNDCNLGKISKFNEFLRIENIIISKKKILGGSNLSDILCLFENIKSIKKLKIPSDCDLEYINFNYLSDKFSDNQVELINLVILEKDRKDGENHKNEDYFKNYLKFPICFPKLKKLKIDCISDLSELFNYLEGKSEFSGIVLEYEKLKDNYDDNDF